MKPGSFTVLLHAQFEHRHSHTMKYGRTLKKHSRSSYTNDNDIFSVTYNWQRGLRGLRLHASRIGTWLITGSRGTHRRDR